MADVNNQVVASRDKRRRYHNPSRPRKGSRGASPRNHRPSRFRVVPNYCPTQPIHPGRQTAFFPRGMMHQRRSAVIQILPRPNKKAPDRLGIGPRQILQASRQYKIPRRFPHSVSQHMRSPHRPRTRVAYALYLARDHHPILQSVSPPRLTQPRSIRFMGPIQGRCGRRQATRKLRKPNVVQGQKPRACRCRPTKFYPKQLPRMAIQIPCRSQQLEMFPRIYRSGTKDKDLRDNRGACPSVIRVQGRRDRRRRPRKRGGVKP